MKNEPTAKTCASHLTFFSCLRALPPASLPYCLSVSAFEANPFQTAENLIRWLQTPIPLPRAKKSCRTKPIRRSPLAKGGRGVDLPFVPSCLCAFVPLCLRAFPSCLAGPPICWAGCLVASLHCCLVALLPCCLVALPARQSVGRVASPKKPYLAIRSQRHSG